MRTEERDFPSNTHCRPHIVVFAYSPDSLGGFFRLANERFSSAPSAARAALPSQSHRATDQDTELPSPTAKFQNGQTRISGPLHRGEYGQVDW